MSKHQILTALKDLYPHCRHFMNRSPDTIVSFLSGYLGTLERAFGDLDTRHQVGEWVTTVCRNWLDRLTEHEQKFPTPDQVRDLAKVYEDKPRDDRTGAWRELSDSEYQDLSLSEKVRYLTILSFEQRKMAGGMYPKGKGEGPINPTKWAKYIPLSEQTEAEMKRLRKILTAKRAADGKVDIPLNHEPKLLSFMRPVTP